VPSSGEKPQRVTIIRARPGLQDARRILDERKDDLEALARGLLEYETLSGDDSAAG
jgi:ATP-dependent Zn protease